jgi:hypothetical protein
MKNDKDFSIGDEKPKYLYKAHSYLNNFYSGGWRYSDVSIPSRPGMRQLRETA